MGRYVIDGKVIFEPQYIYNQAVKEIASLVGVGARSDGKIYLSDVCQGKGINIWAKNKPFRYNAEYFNTDAERDAARKESAYGIEADTTPHDRNDNVFISKWKLADLSGFRKRIKDFKGYNHNATGGVELLNKDSYSTFSASTVILLKTETPTNDGVSLEEMLEYFVMPIKSYQWVLIDSFGFVYGLRGFSSYENLLANLNSGEYYFYAEEFTPSLSEWRNNPSKPTPFIPALPNGKLTLGLAGVTDSLPSISNPYTQNRRLLFNSVELTETRGNLMGLTTTFGVSGFNANMLIGSIHDGKSPLYNQRSGEYIDCCIDDCVFMGFQIYQNLQDSVQYSLSNYLEVDVYVNGAPYWSRVPFYNGGDSVSNFTVLKGQLYGSQGKNSGNAWSEGCFYFATQQLFNAFPEQTEFELRFTIANYMQTFQGLPFATLRIRNTGKYVSDITPKANYPTSRTIAFYRYS